MSYLIAGYNTASKEEKEKYEEGKLINFVGNLLMMSSALLMLGVLMAILLGNYEESIILSSWIFFTIFLLAGVIYANTGNRLKK